MPWSCAEEALLSLIARRDPTGTGLEGPLALRLLQRLLAWDPAARPTAAQALEHAYFVDGAGAGAAADHDGVGADAGAGAGAASAGAGSGYGRASERAWGAKADALQRASKGADDGMVSASKQAHKQQNDVAVGYGAEGDSTLHASTRGNGHQDVLIRCGNTAMGMSGWC